MTCKGTAVERACFANIWGLQIFISWLTSILYAKH
jgi:hypothetical protein